MTQPHERGCTLIPLIDIVIDERARNGVWCTTPYTGHPKGCPNFSKGCTAGRNFERDIQNKYRWFAIIEEFDLKDHTEKMKTTHPEWSDRQCRNPLYWQNGVRKRLRESWRAVDPKHHEWGHILILIPEAWGVDVFETMRRVGVTIDRKPDIVRKVAFVGIPQVDELQGCASWQKK